MGHQQQLCNSSPLIHWVYQQPHSSLPSPFFRGRETRICMGLCTIQQICCIGIGSQEIRQSAVEILCPVSWILPDLFPLPWIQQRFDVTLDCSHGGCYNCVFLLRKDGVFWSVLVRCLMLTFICKISYARKLKNAFALRVRLSFFRLWETRIGITVFVFWP